MMLFKGVGLCLLPYFFRSVYMNKIVKYDNFIIKLLC